MTVTDDIRLYLAEKQRILTDLPVPAIEKAADMLFRTYAEGGTVFMMANGGNAGTLDHAFCDLKHHPFVSEDKSTALGTDVRRLTVVNLCTSAAELTGLVNDLGSDDMFAASLAPFVTPRDLVMAYSGSGNSPNVVRALQVAVDAGARTFAMTKGDGGRCRALADATLVVPGTSAFPGQTGKNDNNFHFEDEMLSVNHMLTGLLKQHVAEQAHRSVASGRW